MRTATVRGSARAPGFDADGLVAVVAEAIASAPWFGAPGLSWELWNEALLEPLRSFLTRPAKFLRAELVALGWSIAGGVGPPPPALPALAEVLHAGSLIVDDVEDGSAERRAGPALHVQFGVPVAINTGNFLYFLAEALLERASLPAPIELSIRRRLTRMLVAGHAGQALDLGMSLENVPRAKVVEVVRATTLLKTAGPMAFAMYLGAHAAGCSEDLSQPIVSFALELGIGLQMYNDLAGLTSERHLSKGHEDLVHRRLTWPWAWAAQVCADPEYEVLRALSDEVAAGLALPYLLLEELAGRAAVRGQREAEGQLELALQALGPARHRSQVESVLQRIRACYA